MSAERGRLLAESILENEALTGDLDDIAAKPLLHWATACAQRIGDSAVALDEAAFEIETYPRMRALRKMMKTITRWLADPKALPPEEAAEQLEKIITEAETVYGAQFRRPAPDAIERFLQASAFQPAAMSVHQLRQMFEPPA